MRIFVLASLFAAASFVACSGGVETTSSSTGTGGQGTSSSSGTGGGASSSSGSSSSGGAHGDCQTDADCGGGKCVPITPGGYLICTSSPPEATMCGMMGEPDQCCSSADCAAMGGGACYDGSDLQFCGGAFPGFNQCVVDGCAGDAECPSAPNAICVPQGAFGLPNRACLTAFCRTDADCAKKPGGACLLVGGNPCCSHPAPDGLGCVYAGGCSKDVECPNGSCMLDTVSGEGVCGPPNPGCPP